jgi:hypothetical protein
MPGFNIPKQFGSEPTSRPWSFRGIRVYRHPSPTHATKGSKGKVTWKGTDQVRSGAQRASGQTGRRRGVRCTNQSRTSSLSPEDAEEAGHGPFVEYKSALGPNGSMTAVYGLESIGRKGVHQQYRIQHLQERCYQSTERNEVGDHDPSLEPSQKLVRRIACGDRSIRRMLLVVNVQLTRAYETTRQCTKNSVCAGLRALWTFWTHTSASPRQSSKDNCCEKH